MANKTIYPYGADGTLPSSIGLINDLTTGGADKALTAQQGKVIGDILLNARLVEVDFPRLTRYNCSLYSSKKWGYNNSVEQHVVIPCSPGETFLITTFGGNAAGNYYAWLTSSHVLAPVAHTTTAYVSGTDRTWVDTGDTELITAPDTTAYLCLTVVNGAEKTNNRGNWTVYRVIELDETFNNIATDTDVIKAKETIDSLPYQKVGHFSVDGNGTNYVSCSLGELIPGEEYKVVLDNLSWVYNDAVPATNVYQFDIRYHVDETTSSPIFVSFKTDPVRSEYEFTAVSNREYFFGGRCLVGESIGLTLYRKISERIKLDLTNETKLLISQSKYSSTGNILGLVHFSDIHGDTLSANHILSVHDGLSEYIDDMVSTGDSVHFYAEGTTTYPNGYLWWKSSGLPEKSLFVLGNHDGATTNATEFDVLRGGSAWDGKGKEWDYQTYFADYISLLGYTMPDGYDNNESANYHACYWHKDYTASKVRLIGLDCMHRFDGTINPETGEMLSTGVHWKTNEQELWFIEKLNETLNSESVVYGYSVVVVAHYCLDPYNGDNNITNTSASGGRVIDYKTTAPTNFHLGSASSFSLDNYGFNYRSKNSNYSNRSENNFADILMSWKTRGGKFVAWLCGHMHYDLLYYPTNYPDLLCVAVDQAGWLRKTAHGNRETIDDGRMCLNYYAIDPESGLFKIVRIGFSCNRFLQPIHFICYDYINKKVINEG